MATTTIEEADRPVVPDESHVFALAGLPGSGKSTAAEIIETELINNFEQATHCEVSGFCRYLYSNETGQDDINDNALGRWTARYKEENGTGSILREMSLVLRHPIAPHYAISGLRSPEEAEAVRDVFGEDNTTVIAIWTLPDIRFERKYGDVPSVEHPKWDEFQERNGREIHDWDCLSYFVDGGPSDYIVPNNDGLGTFEGKLTQIIRAEMSDRPNNAHRYERPPFPGTVREIVAQYL